MQNKVAGNTTMETANAKMYKLALLMLNKFLFVKIAIGILL